MTLTERLYLAVKAAIPDVDGVWIPDPHDRASWRVRPSQFQAQAQAIIDVLPLVEPPKRTTPAAGRYLGMVDADPDAPMDGDLWLLRHRYPTQRRTLKYRDGAVTRTLMTSTL